MSQSESLLRRWSRLKIQARQASPSSPLPAPATVPLSLPDAPDFGADSDPYIHSDMDRHTRQDALRKLFMADRYRAMDGLDVYVGDYSNPELLPADLLDKLDHVRDLLCMGEPEEGSDAVKQGGLG